MKSFTLILALFLTVPFIIRAQHTPPVEQAESEVQADITNQVKAKSLGTWKSIATEVRPSASKTEDGRLKPFYLKRQVQFLPGDKFELEILNFADAFGKVPLAKIFIKGRTEWKGSHLIADSAQKVNFLADEAYEVTPLIENFALVLNKVAKDGFETWTVGKPQSILKKKFLPFGLSTGQIFEEYDLVFIYQNMMFWGARNVDGRGFDTEENRPTNLQVPLIRTVVKSAKK